MSETNYDRAQKAAVNAWSSTDRAAIGAVALAILALVDELKAGRTA